MPRVTVSASRTSGPFPSIWGLLRTMCRVGHLAVIDKSGRKRDFGDQRTGPSVTVRLHDRMLPLRLVLNPSLAFGEAYMDGTLTIERGSLGDLLHLATQSLGTLDTHPIECVRAWFGRSLRQRNHQNRAHANVAHHYDLSEALYDLFLDADRQYSCAYFTRGDETLEAAQQAKKRHLAAKLLLEPGCQVLDIGSGWGGLALELAETDNVDVTGITLSAEQLKSARRRAAATGLSDQVRFELRDFREEEGRYDRVVSVGMFEHVGPADYVTFFESVARALKPDGVALVHSIGRIGPPGTSDPWLTKYIFPGGYVPALSEVLAAVEKVGLWVADIEILRVHYADTLRHWHDRFQAKRAEAEALYDERFCRMWEFYLVACEMLFRNGPLMVFQIQLAHRRDAVPLTRDYIGARATDQRSASHLDKPGLPFGEAAEAPRYRPIPAPWNLAAISLPAA
jgi:cyclopropane-fatty-acyl-phospholipid synthase